MFTTETFNRQIEKIVDEIYSDDIAELYDFIACWDDEFYEFTDYCHKKFQFQNSRIGKLEKRIRELEVTISKF